MVKIYYQKRLDLFLGYLQETFDRADTYDYEQLNNRYRKATEEFISTPFEQYGTAESVYLDKPIKAVREVLDKLSILEIKEF